MDQGRLFAADEGPGADAHVGVKGEIGAHHGTADNTAPPCIADRAPDSSNGNWILAADIEVAVAGANGIGADDHAFQHAMRIVFHDSAIHVGAGVALIAVNNDEFSRLLFLANEMPFETGRKAGASAAAQSAPLDLVTNLLRRHVFQDVGQRLIAIVSQIILETVGVDLPRFGQYDTSLLGEER